MTMVMIKITAIITIGNILMIIIMRRMMGDDDNDVDDRNNGDVDGNLK